MANTFSIDLELASTQYGSAASIAAYAPSSYTLEAWIKPESIVSSHNIFGKDKSGGRQFTFRVISTGQLEIEHYDNGGISYIVDTTNASTTTAIWQHVAVVNTAGTFTFYKNGVLLSTAAPSGTYGALGDKSGTALNIGRREFSGAEEYFDGLIDECRFWNTARTGAQISGNMSSELVGNESGLIGYWKFNEGAGTNVNDETSNNNDLTLVGSPVFSVDIPFGVSGALDLSSKMW